MEPVSEKGVKTGGANREMQAENLNSKRHEDIFGVYFHDTSTAGCKLNFTITSAPQGLVKL